MLIGILITIPYVEILEYPVIIFVSVFIVYYFVYQNILSYISAYLYCRFSLKMPLNISQIKQLKNVISPAFSFSLAWPSLKEVKSLEPNQRFPKALDLCTQWTSNKKTKRQKRWERIQKSSTKTKVYLIIWVFWIAYSGFASVFNLVPAKSINKLIVQFTGLEIPMFTFIALVAISLLLIYILDKEGFRNIREIDSYDL